MKQSGGGKGQHIMRDNFLFRYRKYVNQNIIRDVCTRRDNIIKSHAIKANLVYRLWNVGCCLNWSWVKGFTEKINLPENFYYDIT